MNKLYTILMCCFIFASGHAQLSGTVTINSTMPATGTNFQSFTAFANTLNVQGVSGHLVVNVVANTGPYVEQPVFNQAPGISATKTITIRGNNNLLTASASPSQQWTLLLNGADYMYFEQLKVSGTGSNNAMVCLLSNDASNNSFSSCNFSCNISGTSINLVPVAISQSSNGTGGSLPSGSNNVFLNCDMYGGYMAVYVSGPSAQPFSSNNAFLGCTMREWYYNGLSCSYQKNFSLKKCTVSRPNRTVISGTDAVRFSNNPGGLVVDGNCVSDMFTSVPTMTNTINGIYIYDADPNLTPMVIKNNLVNNLGGTGSTYGFYFSNFYGSCNNNTVIINNTTTLSTSAYGIYAIPVTQDSAKFQNNYVAVTHGPGTQYGLYLGGVVGKTLITGNRYYIPSAAGSFIGYYSSSVSSFSAWQGQGLDLQGAYYATNPNFTITAPCGVYTATTSTVTVNLPEEKETLFFAELFPNPTSGSLSVILKNKGSKTITVRDVSGRCVLLTETPEALLQLDLSVVPQGFYFIEISDPDHFSVFKVLKE